MLTVPGKQPLVIILLSILALIRRFKKDNSSSLAGLFLLKVFDVNLRSSLVRRHLEIEVSVTHIIVANYVQSDFTTSSLLKLMLLQFIGLLQMQLSYNIPV